MNAIYILDFVQFKIMKRGERLHALQTHVFNVQQQ